MLFAGIDATLFQKLSFAIGWNSQGSGLSFTRQDLLDTPLPALQDYAKRATAQRKREAKAAREAAEAHRPNKQRR